MKFTGKIGLVFVFLFVVFLTNCKKENVSGDLIGNNDAPYYDGLSTVLVQNYVNRLYIDLIGREPLDVEMTDDVQRLKDSRYDFLERDSIIDRLQTDENFIEGDSSYKAAYYNRLYELFKVKMLEGASNKDVQYEQGLLKGAMISDSVSGDWLNYQIHKAMVEKLDAVLAIDTEYRDAVIDVKDVFARLLDNAVYDRINMNTFNFLNAAFNDLFDRFPSDMEFANGYEIIENNIPSTIFGQPASNKAEFIQILVNSQEFYEGMIRWTYGTLLARDTKTDELEYGMNTFYFDHDLPGFKEQF